MRHHPHPMSSPIDSLNPQWQTSSWSWAMRHDELFIAKF
jgi:hypothetical protein